MSTKKPSFVEIHCEKILTAVIGLLLVSVLVWQILFLNINVKVGTENVSLGNLGEKLEKKSQVVSKKLDPNSPLQLEIPEPKKVPSDEIFETEKVIGIAPNKSLPRIEPSFSGLLTGETLSNNQWFYDPNFAAGQMSGVSISTDAVDISQLSEEDQKLDFFQKFFPPNSADLVWATPWMVIDLNSFRQELMKSDLESSPRKEVIPKLWFNDNLHILDVVFERREKLTNETWSEPVIIKPVPLQDSWRPVIESRESSASQRDTVFANLSDFDLQMDVLQPALFPLKGGNFIEPSNDVAGSSPLENPEDAARKVMEKKISSAEAALERSQAELKKAGGRLDPPTKGDSSSQDSDSKGKAKGGGGGGGMGMGGGGGSMKKGDTGADGGAGGQGNKELRIRLTKRVNRESKSLESLENEFEKKYPATKIEINDSKKAKEPEKELKDLQEVVAWTHDFDLREGATYQYRTTLKIYNPFFTRKILLVTEQQQLSGGIAVSSLTSEWGAEVTIPSTTEFFLTRGSARHGIGGRRITLEYFRFFNGVLRSVSEDLTLGDPVGRVVGSKGEAVDYSTQWYLSDIFDDAGSQESGGVLAVFQQRTESGEIVKEIRSLAGPLADKNSEKYKKFKKQLPASAPKKVAVQTPKA
ncbi:MAG: hypothetical protein O3B75_07585 [Planctomycetota bacterium]|nr:hypothetical protein [Planctomycetota bacterium]